MGDTIVIGQDLTQLDSSDGGFSIKFQKDGNLVLYDNQSQAPLWASNTENVGATCKFYSEQSGDVRLGVFGPANNYRWIVQFSGVAQAAGSYCKMQTDGNFVIYDGGNNPLWATNTNAASPTEQAVRQQVKRPHGEHAKKPHHAEHEVKPSHGELEVKPSHGEREEKPQHAEHKPSHRAKK